jgi:hypothetical protein
MLRIREQNKEAEESGDPIRACAKLAHANDSFSL